MPADLSVVIPAFNESGRLGPTLDRVVAALAGREYEILVVDDGSTDGTAELVRRHGARHLRLIELGTNRGKGAAIRTGVLASAGRRVLLCDADLSTPIEAIAVLEAALDDGAALAIGSRAVATADVRVRQPFYRELMGKTFNALIRLSGVRGFRDTQCGFKLLDGDVGRDLFARMKIDRFAFDVELVWLALRLGHRVDEVGVPWINSADSRVHPIFDSANMLRDVLRIRRLHRDVPAVAGARAPIAIKSRLLLCLLVLLAGGCRDRVPTTRLAHEDFALEAPGPALPAAARAADIQLDLERRPALVVPAGEAWRWTLDVPAGARLEVGVGLPEQPKETPPARAARAVIELSGPGGREVLDVGEVAAGRWAELRADLAAYAGSEITLEFRIEGLPAGFGVAWAPVSVAAPLADPAASRPNIVFVLIDTVRHDHLKAYGYDRDTMPELDRLLVAPGLVVESAYAQAPWTLPSAVSYMASRYPGELLGRDPAAFGIPAGVTSLPEVLQRLGYRTAGFLGNPTLREENGFGRGFDTFHTPLGLEALFLNAGDLHRRIAPWLAAHQQEPFFLYAHFIDPHDPYTNPDLVGGKSPWFDDPGGISGEWIHGVYGGVLKLDDPERDRRHLISLYDSEIRFADRYLGRLVETLAPDVLARTLFVFASDHGEEFFDHGGWKHGQSLYEEQIHVPLVFRWDGHIAAGGRLDATVRLLDIAPTVVAAAGGEAPADWQGVNLLPALTGAAPAPRLAAFSQHLAHGPLRASAVLDGKKLIRFNPREPFVPADRLQQHLYEVDLERFAATELYDLEADPREQRDLAREPGATTAVAPLSPVLLSHLDRTLVGPRAVTEGLGPGAVLTGELLFERPPEGWRPLFLGPGDQVEVHGTTLSFRLVGDLDDKGFLLTADPGDLLSAHLELDGSPLGAERLRVGGGTAWGGGRTAAAALVAVRYPAAHGGPGLRLWRPSGARPSEAAADPATRDGLRALGYIQ